MLNLFMKLFFNIFILALSFLFGLYGFMPWILDFLDFCNFGLDTTVYADSSAVVKDPVTLLDKAPVDDSSFYKRSDLFLGLLLIGSLVVVGITLWYFFGSSDSPKGDASVQTEVTSYNSVASQTDISLLGEGNLEVVQMANISTQTVPHMNLPLVDGEPSRVVVHYPYFNSPTDLPFVGTDDAVTTPVAPLWRPEAVEYLMNSSPTTSDLDLVGDTIASTGIHPWDPDPMSEFYIG